MPDFEESIAITRPTVAFGIPMEAIDYIPEGVADELLAAYTNSGLVGLEATLDERVNGGTVPRIVAAHVLAWMKAKTTSSMYVFEYAMFCREMLGEWSKEGFPTPVLDNGLDDDGFDDFGPLPYRAPSLPGRNDPCHCGSGRKYKRCHGG